jgi:hypothetical protein
MQGNKKQLPVSQFQIQATQKTSPSLRVRDVLQRIECSYRFSNLPAKLRFSLKCKPPLLINPDNQTGDVAMIC